jgi:hypothetical protein
MKPFAATGAQAETETDENASKRQRGHKAGRRLKPERPPNFAAPMRTAQIELGRLN